MQEKKMPDLIHKAREIIANESYKTPGPIDQETLVQLAKFYADHFVEDGEEVAEFDWMQERGWLIRGNEGMGYFAVFKAGQPSTHTHRFITVDDRGVSFSLRHTLHGYPGDDGYPITSFPIRKGMPNRRQVIALELFFQVFP